MPVLSGAELALIASLVAIDPSAMPPQEGLACLSRNVYFEARGEAAETGTDGAVAVIETTLNRVKDPRWPNTICEVVYQDLGPNKRDCQFSWTCDGKSDVPGDMGVYGVLTRFTAMAVLWGYPEQAPGATQYYAHDLTSPSRTDNLEEIQVVGGHTFLR